MDQPLYDIFFTGQLVEGADLATAKSNFAQLFKSSPEYLEKLFSGKPQAIKRGVDKTQALKYKNALHKAGLLIAFKAHQTTKPEAASGANEALSPTSPTTATHQQIADWSIAPAGCDILAAHERKQVPPQNIDTSAIKMASTFLEPEATIKVAQPAPDTSHISVAQAGEDLLLKKPEPPPPLPLDLDSFSLAPAGSDLEQLQAYQVPLNPDTSTLSIAEAGADILEGKKRQPPPPAPNTDHITIAKK